jgi:hypothetical protein
MKFHPSDYGDINSAYGEGADVASGEGDSSGAAAQALEQYAPAISALIFGGNPREQYEKKKAQLASYKSMYNSAPNSFLRGIYATKIRSLEAEVKALEELAGEDRAAVLLTQSGKVGGTFMLIAGGVAALMFGNYFRQKSKTEKWKRRQT